jgi:hypothetical protein
MVKAFLYEKNEKQTIMEVGIVKGKMKVVLMFPFLDRFHVFMLFLFK